MRRLRGKRPPGPWPPPRREARWGGLPSPAARPHPRGASATPRRRRGPPPRHASPTRRRPPVGPPPLLERARRGPCPRRGGTAPPCGIGPGGEPAGRGRWPAGGPCRSSDGGASQRGASRRPCPPTTSCPPPSRSRPSASADAAPEAGRPPGSARAGTARTRPRSRTRPPCCARPACAASSRSRGRSGGCPAGGTWRDRESRIVYETSNKRCLEVRGGIA